MCHSPVIGYANNSPSILNRAPATYAAAWSFTHNPASQIASETRDNDAYAFGDHVTANVDYTVNGLNQYTAVNANSYTFDAGGNLTSDGTTTFAYDTENRLVTATGGNTATLRYDPLGRLFEVTDSAGNIRRLYYSGQDLVAEYNGAGTLLRHAVHAELVEASTASRAEMMRWCGTRAQRCG